MTSEEKIALLELHGAVVKYGPTNYFLVLPSKRFSCISHGMWCTPAEDGDDWWDWPVKSIKSLPAKAIQKITFQFLALFLGLSE